MPPGNAKIEVEQLGAEMVQQKAGQPSAPAAPPPQPPAAGASAAEAAGPEASDAGAQAQTPAVVAPGFQIVYPGVRKQVVRAGDGITYPSTGDALRSSWTSSFDATMIATVVRTARPARTAGASGSWGSLPTRDSMGPLKREGRTAPRTT